MEQLTDVRPEGNSFGQTLQLVRDAQREGNRLYNEGKYEPAEQNFASALQLSTALGVDAQVEAVLMARIGLCQARQEELAKASGMFSVAVPMLQEFYWKPRTADYVKFDLWNAWMEDARVMEQMGHPVKAHNGSWGLGRRV